MTQNLENHTVVELKALAKKKELRGYSKLRKAELISLIRSSISGNVSGTFGGGGSIDKCQNKKCNTDSICNPQSGRCVKKSGKIGIKLIQNPPPQPIRTPPLHPIVKPIIRTPPLHPIVKPIIRTPPQSIRTPPQPIRTPPLHPIVKPLTTKKPLTSPLHMMQPDIKSKIAITATPWYDLIGMLWLLHNHPKECVAIPKGLLTHSGKISVPVFMWSQTSLEWQEKSKLFVVPPGLWESIKDCLKKGSEFIVIPMGFNCNNKFGHQNFLIYNSITKEMERFEPNGGVVNPCLKNPKMIPQLIDLFHKNVKKDMIKTFYEPLDFCPAKSFQLIQHNDGTRHKTEKGFCLSWSYWYADTRLRNPNKTRKQVVDMALNSLYSNKFVPFTSFIRSFSNFLKKVGDEIKISGDPAAVFKKYTLKNT